VFFFQTQNMEDKEILKNHRLRVKVETSNFKMLFQFFVYDLSASFSGLKIA